MLLRSKERAAKIDYSECVHSERDTLERDVHLVPSRAMSKFNDENSRLLQISFATDFVSQNSLLFPVSFLSNWSHLHVFRVVFSSCATWQIYDRYQDGSVSIRVSIHLYQEWMCNVWGNHLSVIDSAGEKNKRRSPLLCLRSKRSSGGHRQRALRPSRRLPRRSAPEQ